MFREVQIRVDESRKQGRRVVSGPSNQDSGSVAPAKLLEVYDGAIGAQESQKCFGSTWMVIFYNWPRDPNIRPQNVRHLLVAICCRRPSIEGQNGVGNFTYFLFENAILTRTS
jgi:hypothetical protein